MIAGLPTWAVATIALLAIAAVAGFIEAARSQATTDEFEEFRNDDGSLPDVVSLDPPTMRGSRFGVIGEMLKTWRYLNKTEKLAGKGYVKWYLIDDTFPKPKFVKPEDENGTGIPRVEHDDGVYLFPRDAAKGSAENGMWTFIHQAGDAEPLNIHDYRETVLKPEEVEEWLTQTVSSEQPTDGLLDIFGDVDPRVLIGGGIAFAVVWSVMSSGGGII